jgi:hypothetical protein
MVQRKSGSSDPTGTDGNLSAYQLSGVRKLSVHCSGNRRSTKRRKRLWRRAYSLKPQVLSSELAEGGQPLLY